MAHTKFQHFVGSFFFVFNSHLYLDETAKRKIKKKIKKTCFKIRFTRKRVCVWGCCCCFCFCSNLIINVLTSFLVIGRALCSILKTKYNIQMWYLYWKRFWKSVIGWRELNMVRYLKCSIGLVRDYFFFVSFV